MTRAEARRPLSAAAAALLLVCLALILSCHVESTPPPAENWVSVRLDDSLSKFHTVDVIILSATDTGMVLGKAWSGHLDNPSELPDYRLRDGESRPVAVRVKGYDDNGKLALDLLITKVDGHQSVASLLPVPVPDTSTPGKPVLPLRLASLGISPGTLDPPFNPLIEDYQVSLTYDQSSIILTPVAATDTATIRVQGVRVGRGQSSDPVDLLVGQNEITVRVSTGDTAVRYSIKAIRAARIDVPQDTTPDNPALVLWKHKTTVGVNVHFIGSKPATVKDYPLLVRLDKNNFNFSEARHGGQDLRFALQGKMLDHEISRWDTAAEVAEIWVRLDSVRMDAAFPSLHMYWGNPIATNSSNPAAVFPASGGHNAVWHLGENGRGDPEEFKDATGRYHGRGGGTMGKPPRRTAGVVGYGQNFMFGGTPGVIELPKSFDPGDAWSMHFWMKAEGGKKGVIFQKGDTWGVDDQRFQLTVQDGGAQSLAIHKRDASLVTDIFVPTSVYFFVGITYDGEKVTFYVDGFPRQTHNPWKFGPDGASAARIGAAHPAGTDLPLNGSLDELWFSTQQRSAEWMRLAYENQRPLSYLVVVNPSPADPATIPDLPPLSKVRDILTP